MDYVVHFFPSFLVDCKQRIFESQVIWDDKKAFGSAQHNDERVWIFTQNKKKIENVYLHNLLLQNSKRKKNENLFQKWNEKKKMSVAFHSFTISNSTYLHLNGSIVWQSNWKWRDERWLCGAE